MSELKYYKLFHRTSALTSPEFISVVEFGNSDEVYLKSEADKVIAEKDKEIAELKEQVHDYAQGLYVMQARAEMKLRHSNHKRCLAMAYAEWLKQMSLYNFPESILYRRAARRERKWKEMAQNFKEAK